ncbi:hypothetical protein VN97_g5770 [Penicillium thymicola]|uniref:Uncharacterized protein n=1 Tax=Penicillium thymicola TaxID=293382 RepID=A0AAI9TIU4_PENTH|nr:hypothetical protein VN97_g5770 [Penicillium thymicola]
MSFGVDPTLCVDLQIVVLSNHIRKIGSCIKDANLNSIGGLAEWLRRLIRNQFCSQAQVRILQPSIRFPTGYQLGDTQKKTWGIPAKPAYIIIQF